MADQSTPDELQLGAEFPAPTADQWRELVDKVLDGAPFERKLVHTTYDGLRVAPLYVDGDGPGSDAAGLPGAAPFVRGATATASVDGGWDVRQYHHGDDAAAVNRAVLADLERGVTSIVLGPVGDRGEAALRAALDGVYLDIAPVALDQGPQSVAAARWLQALCAERGLNPAAVRADLGVDPLGALARHGWLARPVAEALGELGELATATRAAWPAMTTARVDATVYADAGASAADEIGAALATGVAYLRTLVAAGFEVDDALGQITFRLTADADQFATMAKLRAARRAWARVAEASGAGAAGAMRIHAVTACAMYTRRDPWVNLLRATLACFAAAVGGAEAVTVLPFGAAAGQWDELGVRLARNTQIILAEESGLHRVIDPAGGSWYVETRTDELAAAAWSRLQAIEAAGGMAAVLADGSFAATVAATWEARRSNLARRREAITGVSEFPDLDQAPLTVTGGLDAVIEPPAGAAVVVDPFPLRRHAAPFEALRDRADALATSDAGRPAVFLANLGPIAVHTARATFAKNFFEVGGLRAIGNDGFAAAEQAAAAFRGSGADRAVICSSDAVYGELAEAVAAALKQAGATTVYLAGNPGDRRAAYEAAGVDEFIYVGCDVLDVLERALPA
ncbi:MAG: methylmalonyl-CoA mutase family protein [Acidimicrobiales bacterium]